MYRINDFLKSGYYKSIGVYIALFLVVLSLTNVRQRMVTNFHCEICADKAGYFMYLPAVFYLGFESENYPKEFDVQHGEGFHIDRSNNVVITKFTCGVAMLLSPFYGAGVLVAKMFSLDVPPYSYYFLFFINMGAAFYVVLGLYFLRKWLNYYVDDFSAFLTILIVFFGTNLFYYTLDESLMSHLYSFSLFSAVLYGAKSFYETKKSKYFLLFVISLSIAVLIRPTNILFAFIALFTDVNRIDILKNKLTQFIVPKYLISGILIFILIILPQVIYWKFAFGKYIVWSYEDEGFTLWNSPQFLAVWFSPQSGLFTYTPIILLSLFFSVVMFFKKERNSGLIMATFIVISYMCASWHNPYFGMCNFGKRPMIEYYPILMLPISYMLSYYKSFHTANRYLVLISTAVFICYNQALFLAFDTCFFGEPWEWNKFGLLLKMAFLVIH